MDVGVHTANESLRELLAAVSVEPPDHFRWFGVRYGPSGLELGSRTAGDRRSILREGLRGHLYENFYCSGGARRPALDLEQKSSSGSEQAFLKELKDANRGHGPWHKGWTVTKVSETHAVVARDGLSVNVDLCDVRRESPLEHTPIVEGDRVDLRMPPALVGISPGYYMAVGDLDLDGGNEIVARLYWNATPTVAPVIISRLTQGLNRDGYAFRLKALKDPASYTRCDSVVLYVEKRAVARIRDLLVTTYDKVKDGLRSDVPAFTKRLAPGLGAADDPGSDESFGSHRCGLLTDALMALPPGANFEAAYSGLDAAFSNAALDLAAPYLGPSAEDVYEPLGDDIPDPAARRNSLPIHLKVRPIEIAQRIGDLLVEEAIWDDDVCNWLGSSPAEGAGTKAHDALPNGSLDGDIYGGTAGIAMFLAGLATVSSRGSAFRETALGAVRHSLISKQGVEASAQWGLFDGSTGIALAARWTGDLLGETDLVPQADGLIARPHRSATASEGGSDIISGGAGAIVGLLAYERISSAGWLVERAMEIADELVECATSTPSGGLSWPSLALDGRLVALTGLSHGAAGVGLALSLLGARCQASRFLEGSRRAFRYERDYFSAVDENWSDLRWRGGRQKGSKWATHATFWCHGAAGIALSRMLAAEALNDDQCSSDMGHALRTTQRYLEHTVRPAEESIVLCHGSLGNAEVLRHADRNHVGSRRQFGELVDSVAEDAAGRFLQNPETWPCRGSGGLVIPGYMCGLAGVGHFFLRSAFPECPSILLLDPGGFQAGSVLRYDAALRA